MNGKAWQHLNKQLPPGSVRCLTHGVLCLLMLILCVESPCPAYGTDIAGLRATAHFPSADLLGDY